MNPSPQSAAPPPDSPGRRRLAVDLVIAVVLLVGSGAWATTYWNAWVARGGDPEFYQTYFEPAVMVACGKGFVVSQPAPPVALAAFLQRQTDTFSCADLPADLVVGETGMFQGAWIYLEMMVGWAWWLLGISWSGMGPLFGLLFGISIALAFGIFRLGMGRLVAVIGSLGLTVSAAHLMSLPNLRDYAKAPFTLGLVLIVGLLVVLPATRKSVLWLSAAFGAVLGVGYGFRTDFLACLPVLPATLFLFLDGGVMKRWALKAAGTAVFVATFILVSWPALTTVYTKGGCQWHVAMLGLQSPFDEPLHIGAAPYDFGYAYSDGYIAWTVLGYAQRVQPQLATLPFCSHEYDVAATFPADLIARAYGSVVQIADLPFLWWAAPSPGWAQSFYEARAAFLRPKIGSGAVIVGVALLVASASSLRLGLFLLFFLAYFGGYPAIQFQTRHHFHLEFITFWAAGFIVHSVVSSAWILRRSGIPEWRVIGQACGRTAAFATIAAVLVLGGLSTARWYQQRRATELFRGYLAAPKVPLALPEGRLPERAERRWPELVQVDINQAACGPAPAVTFRHRTTPADGDLSRTVTLPAAAAPGLTRVLFPVFELFDRLEFSDAQPGCVVGAYAVSELTRFPLLLGAVLPPGWDSLPLHQRLRDWEATPVMK